MCVYQREGVELGSERDKERGWGIEKHNEGKTGGRVADLKTKFLKGIGRGRSRKEYLIQRAFFSFFTFS